MINVKLNEKPTSVSIRYNGYYKIVLLLAIIKYCAPSKKSSFDLIHIVFWSLRNETNYNVLMDLSNKLRDSLIPWTFEYGIDEVLSLGFINNYIERVTVGDTLEIRLSNKGEEILQQIEEFELFTEEIDKIRALGKIPKNRLNAANKKWKLI